MSEESLNKKYMQLKVDMSKMNHDLRNPLTNIKTYSQLLEEGILGDLNSKQADAIKVILENTEKLKDMLDYCAENMER